MEIKGRREFRERISELVVVCVVEEYDVVGAVDLREAVASGAWTAAPSPTVPIGGRHRSATTA
jgi:hypothetical protein